MKILQTIRIALNTLEHFHHKEHENGGSKSILPFYACFNPHSCLLPAAGETKALLKSPQTQAQKLRRATVRLSAGGER